MSLPDSPTPLANQLLIALPSLAEPSFSKSVALICQHDEDGALGIVMNRPSEYTVGEVLEQMGLSGGSDALRSQIVLNGGPVHRERGFVIHDGGTRWDSTLAIGDDLWLTTSREILEAMARGEGPEHAVIALGCAGWGAGQLEQELTVDNSWLTAPADPDLLFDTPLEQRWEAAAGRIGVDFARLADYAGHA
ncbi:YqgE/AlgH family protein [Lysobacter sp. N42]|jgi:putative transcriptional regulator|uniref:YqgE/AlgH family protein n=1 Tax=Lysobacter sp. N42 TaxID=2545719 RepID=UPI0010492059|nr:YqgE/AlgH family protein [Lysobacter sp. N42]